MFVQHGKHIGGHNFKFDILQMNRQFGVPIQIGWDTLLMANVYHESWYKDLKSLATYFCDADSYADRLVHSWLKANIKRPKDRTFDKVPKDRIIEYLYWDIVYNLNVYFELENMLLATGRLRWPYREHEIPQINMLARAEEHGIAFDSDQAKLEGETMAVDLLELDGLIDRYSMGHINNPGSTDQIRHFLFDVEGIPVKKRTSKGVPSTDKTVLDALEGVHPVIDLIKTRRRIAKLKNSYIDNIPKFLETDKFGVERVHPIYKSWNIITHRIAAEKPAIQTIPRSGDPRDNIKSWIVEELGHDFNADYGGRIKRCYIAPPGYDLFAVDGASWELCVAAVLSQDPFLLNAYRTGQDPHGMACDLIFDGVWGKAERANEKRVMFANLYGQTVESAVSVSELTREQKGRVVKFFAEHLSRLIEWKTEMYELAKKQGFIDIPIFNYRCHFDLITPRSDYDLKKIAVNYPVQGCASMITMRAAITAEPELRAIGAHLIATVHDQFMGESLEFRTMEALDISCRHLEAAGSWWSPDVPWKAEPEMGKSWGAMKEVRI
jgi:DNA polymerase-1